MSQNRKQRCAPPPPRGRIMRMRKPLKTQIPVPSASRSLELYSGPPRRDRTACWYSRAAPGGFEPAYPPNVSVPAAPASFTTPRGRVQSSPCRAHARIFVILHDFTVRSRRAMGGKAELQQLRSILSLSYGPLGAYVDPTATIDGCISHICRVLLQPP